MALPLEAADERNFSFIMQFKREAIADTNIGKVSDWKIPGTWPSTSPTTNAGPEKALLLRGRTRRANDHSLPSATCLLTVYYYGSSAIASGSEDQALLGDAHYHTAAEGHRNKRAVRP